MAQRAVGTEAKVSDPDGSVFRVFLDGRHVASYATREQAELAIGRWLREWDGEFTVKAVAPKQRKE